MLKRISSNVLARRRSVLIEALESRTLLSAVDVLTQHNDTNRTGANLNETVLNTSNVNVSTFGRLYSRPVDDQVYSQPLIATNVSVGGGVHNLLLIATVNDTVYAYDADDPTITTPYWTASMLSSAYGAAAGARPVHHDEVGQNCGTYADFSGNIGIVGTPVIDKAANTMFFVARTVENGQFIQRLHALNLSTGAERPGGPMVISASVAGTGQGAVNGVVAFNPQTQNQRDALALDGHTLVIGWASHCDTPPYHGWLMGFNENTLALQWVFNTTPNGSEGGIWMSGAAPAIDAQGNIYFSCGNGDVNTANGDYGEGIFKLSPTGQLLDYFIPNNWQNLNNIDADFGSSGVLLVPGSTTMITGDKEGKFFVVNENNLGHLNTPDQILQEFQVTPSVNNDHIHGAPVYYQDSTGKQWVYVWGMDDKLKQFQFSGSTLVSTTPTFTSNVTFAPTPSQPGGLLSISGNGNVAGTGIVWSMSTLGPSANQQVQPGILRAFDAINVGTELWNSQQNATRDDFGNLAKFSDATIDNGHVYTPTFSNEVVVYGLLAGTLAAPSSLTATAVTGKAEIDLNWAAVSGAADYVIERKVGSGTYQPLAIVGSGTTTFADTSVIAGTNYSYRVRARNSVGDSAPVTASAVAFFTPSLLARWKFDDQTSGGGGTATDSSGNGNNGVVGATATWAAPGQVGVAAMLFTNGAGSATSQVTVNDSSTLDPTSQITVSGWEDAIDWSGNHRILQKGANDNQYRLLVENGVLKFDLAGIGVAQSTTTQLPSLNVWHLVTGTYDGSTIRLYVDGTQIASTVASGSLAVTTDPVILGSKSAGGVANNHMNGKLDDIRLYNYALSASDVASLYANTAPAAPLGLTATPTSPSMVNLAWTDNSTNESGFILERKTGAAGTYAQIASLPAGTTSYIDTNLASSTTYFYRLKAYNVLDASAYTPEVQATTLAPAINSLVAEWKFDETSGTSAADSTGFGNTGALAGGAVRTTDTPDGSHSSLSFNGTTQWVRVESGYYLQPTSTITLAAWVKASDWSGTRGIIAKGDREGAYYIIADQGVLKFNLSGQGTLTAPLPTTGVWHHVAGTYDGATMALYVDGVRVASMAATGPILTSNDPLFIGGTGASAATGQAFAGSIDDARVYNYAITPRDVSALYGNVANWSFSENGGSTAGDSTPNGNTLALVGNPPFVPGIKGPGLSLDGSTQYGSANNNQVLNPTAAISLAAWVDAADWNGAPHIIQKGVSTTQYALFAGDGSLVFTLAGVGTLTAPLPAAGTWHHLAATYDGASMKLYVDGVLIGSKAATGTITAGVDNLFVGFGGNPGTPGTMFHGTLDDVAVFSRALTAGEVNALAGSNNWFVASPGAAYTLLGTAGNTTLSVTAGTVTLNQDFATDYPGTTLTVSPGASVVINSDEHLAGLTINASSVALSSTTADALTLTGALTINSGTLDLGIGSLLLPTSANIATYIARAAGATRPGGVNAWDGSGLTSSIVKADAASNNARALALGYFDSRENATTGLNLPAGDTLVKYTVYGDATGDGVDDTADFTVWRNNAFTGTRWSQGDFNYDGAVDTADFTIWRNNVFKTANSTSAGAPALRGSPAAAVLSSPATSKMAPASAITTASYHHRAAHARHAISAPVARAHPHPVAPTTFSLVPIAARPAVTHGQAQAAATAAGLFAKERDERW